MVNDFKECSCLGRNPHCVKCNGFGMIRPQDTVSVRIPNRFKSSVKKINSTQCPYCSQWVRKLSKHIKKVHPDEGNRVQIQRCNAVEAKVTKSSAISKTEQKLKSSRVSILICPKCGEKVRNDLYKDHCKTHDERKGDLAEVKRRIENRQKAPKQVKKETEPKIGQRKKPLSQPVIGSNLGSYRDILTKLGIEPEPLSTGKVDSSSQRPSKDLTCEGINQNEEALSKLSFLNCPICGARVRKDLYENHCRRKHQSNEKQQFRKSTSSKKKSINGRRYIVKTEMAVQGSNGCNKNLNEKVINTKKEIYLESKRGKRFDEIMTCSACGIPTTPTWRYSSDDGGVVLICARCKPLVFERSFGKKDAMDIAVLGGMFDGNRRRH